MPTGSLKVHEPEPVVGSRLTVQTTLVPSETLTVPVGVPEPWPAAVTVAV